MAKRRKMRPIHPIATASFEALEYSHVSIPSNAQDIVDAVPRLMGIIKTVPQLIDSSTIGDATGYMTPLRDYIYGWDYNPDRSCVRKWRHFPSPATFGNRLVWSNVTVRYEGDYFRHPLGASYRLDNLDRSGVFLPSHLHRAHLRSDPHQGRVLWSGTGVFRVANDTEGWDAIFAAGSKDCTAIHLAMWRGSPRVWMSFGYQELPEYTWSGASAFESVPHRLFTEQVLTGDMPARVFVEWLCENYRLPDCMATHAVCTGFTPQRN